MTQLLKYWHVSIVNKRHVHTRMCTSEKCDTFKKNI